MPDKTGPPQHACGCANVGQALVDEHARRRHVFAPLPGTDEVARVNVLLYRLRMGRSRRNRYGALRKRLRALRALLLAVRRFWEAP